VTRRVSSSIGRIYVWLDVGSQYPEIVLCSGKNKEAVLSKAEDLREQATDAGKRGDKTKSIREGAQEHKRERALNDMADNEDWLDGNLKPPPEKKK
jgi:hypothetical protein